MARRAGFRYSRWDGTQTGFDLDAESLLDEMSDDLLYHGDLNAALRRMMQQGFRDRNDERLMGLREMLERLRERRREELERRDLGGVYDDIAEQLDEVVDMEREGIDRRVDEATRSGDQRRQELVEDVAEERRRQLEEMPPDLAGRVQAMQQYEFMDDAARERFEELMERLRRRRKDELEKYDLGGVYDDIARELREVIDQERKGIDQLEEEARQSGDERRQEITEQVAQEKRTQLDLLPPDLAGQVRDLSE